MRDALHEGLVALYGDCHHDRGEASDCDVLVAALAARSETEPKPAPETTFDPVTGRYPPRESVTEMLAAMNDAETEPEGGTGR